MKETHTNTGSKIRIAHCLIFTGAVFVCSCRSSLQMPPVQPENVSVKKLVPQAIKIVQASLADENPVIRTNAIEVVASTRQTMLMPKVSRLLRDSLVPVRFAAALAIGDLEYSLGKSDAGQMLSDSDENIRIAAAYAMKKLVVSSDIGIIRKAIMSNDQTVRANAVLLLGKCGSEDDLKLLYWALRHKDSSDKVRFQAVESIARLHDERIYPKIWTMLLSVYADDRVMGIKAMGALGTQKAKEAIMTMLDDSVLEVRLAAAEQIGALGETTGEPEVIDVFRKNLIAGADQEGIERKKVLTALAIGRIGTPSLTRYLPELLKDPSKPVRLAAAKAVLQCADGGK